MDALPIMINYYPMTLTGCTDTDLMLLSCMGPMELLAIHGLTKEWDQLTGEIVKTIRNLAGFTIGKKFGWQTKLHDELMGHKTQKSWWLPLHPHMVIFVSAAGNILVVKWLLSQYEFTTWDKWYSFECACLFGHLDMARLLHPHIHNKKIKHSLHTHDIGVLTWLLRDCHSQMDFNKLQEVFLEHCLNNEVIKMECILTNLPENLYANVVHYNHDKALSMTASNGFLQMVQMLITSAHHRNCPYKLSVQIVNIQENAFFAAYWKDHVDIIKWMIDHRDLLKFFNLFQHCKMILSDPKCDTQVKCYPVMKQCWDQLIAEIRGSKQ